MHLQIVYELCDKMHLANSQAAIKRTLYVGFVLNSMHWALEEILVSTERQGSSSGQRPYKPMA